MHLGQVDCQTRQQKDEELRGGHSYGIVKILICFLKIKRM